MLSKKVSNGLKAATQMAWGWFTDTAATVIKYGYVLSIHLSLS